ncbi:hypothetical protein [Chryseobacterium sp. KCF3-3]|uniref:hypothetical protein n=1 Tax=Chryseobacterium sp. KCF3-3 TaxID=3231511 RepID=UPI0038B2861F
MKNKYIGVTLMFYKEESNKYVAVQSSYVLKLSNYKDFKKDVNALVDKIINKEYLNYIFLGITDLYISEKDGKGKYLGRTSYYNYKEIKQAKAITLSKNKINEIICNNQKAKKYNIGLVYFNNDSDGEKFNSTLIIYSQIKNVKNYDDLLFFNTLKFKKKIVKFSIEELKIDDLKLVGFTDFYPVQKKGLFSLVSTFSKISELKKNVIEVKQLRKKFNDVLSDFSYLW